MRRLLSIAAVLLLVTQAVMASVPMLHQPVAPPHKAAHAKSAHDCCPKPVVKAKDCCPRAISCPHPNHGARACCCAESGETAVPSRRIVVNAVVVPTVRLFDKDRRAGGALDANPGGSPLDNSPPVLVLRN